MHLPLSQVNVQSGPVKLVECTYEHAIHIRVMGLLELYQEYYYKSKVQLLKHGYKHIPPAGKFSRGLNFPEGGVTVINELDI